MKKKNAPYTFPELIHIMRTLRSKQGCLWDREQDHATLIPYLFEEAQEVSDAVHHGTERDLQEELGDLLLQVIFHAQIASETSAFTIQDVIDTLARKLIRRHPHVFGKVKVKSTSDIIANWHKIKKREKRNKKVTRSPRPS